MKGVILAGGLGTRLRPVTYEIPKPLLTVKKRPIINYLIELFLRHGINEVGVLTARNLEKDFGLWLQNWAEDLSKAKISIFFEESPRGTFGGMEPLRDWLGDGTFVLSNGDELKDFDLGKLINFHGANSSVGTIAMVKVANPEEYGVPVLDGVKIREFLEKPKNSPSRFISSGLYVLEPEVFDHADFSKETLMIEKDIFPRLAAANKLSGMKMENARWFDCGNMERWEKAIKEW